jgi:hypothetical protein
MRGSLFPGTILSPVALGAVFFAVSVTVFNLTIAIRPATADPPPLREIPEDIFLHEGWAEQNYVGQSRYLDFILGGPEFVRHLGQPRLSGAFLDDLAEGREAYLDAEAPFLSEAQLNELRERGKGLLAQGSETPCIPADPDSEEGIRGCSIEVLVSQDAESQVSTVVLYQVNSSGDGLIFVDAELLDTRSALE